MSANERESRQAKAEELRARGLNPYHDRFATTHGLAAAGALDDDVAVEVAGRVLAMRKFGKLIFATLKDRSGTLQVSFERDQLEPEVFEIPKKLIDIGDFIGVGGVMWTTKKEEKTVRSASITPLSKAARPLPEKWHGLQDREACYRQRYLDLVSNDETLERFVLRSEVTSFIRRFLDERAFLEVETPILQGATSGAAARPFSTHHNALDRDFFLRISPETYLKRLIVGGLDRVYEIGKCFRNEGIDASHLQEFTMLEWYATYFNYRDNMILIRELIQAVLEEFKGGTKVRYEDQELDFGGEWPEVDYFDAVNERTGIDLGRVESHDELARRVGEKYPGFDLSQYPSYPALVDGLYKKMVRPELVQPTFLVHHPTELVPLARRSDENPRVLDMFQVVVNTWEIVKAYSELIDPVDQRNRMMEQQDYRDQGDDETMMLEEDYILCMEHGMPPNSGLGLGIDRFVALLSNVESLRDVVYFPTLREAAPIAAAEDDD